MTKTNNAGDYIARHASEYDAGYAFGFDDNKIPHWRREGYSTEFLRGYDVGKAEIDALVVQADEVRRNYEY
jgi:hypothetical protein